MTRFRHLELLEMTHHRTAGDGIKETRFSGGTTVTTDFTRSGLRVNCERVARPPALSDPTPPD